MIKHAKRTTLQPCLCVNGCKSGLIQGINNVLRKRFFNSESRIEMEVIFMKITEEAKNVLNQVLEENNADGLLVSLQETCCGKSPVFQIAVFDENDPIEEIDGIKVSAGEDEKTVVEDMVIDLVNGELVVLNTVCGCGGECSHDHEGHEGGCCSNH